LLIFRDQILWRRVISIDIDSILDMFDASNTVVFDKTNSVIVVIVDKILQNPILLNQQKINSKQIYNVDDNNKKDKAKSNIYSFNTILIRYLQTVIKIINAERLICRLHKKNKIRN